MKWLVISQDASARRLPRVNTTHLQSSEAIKIIKDTIWQFACSLVVSLGKALNGIASTFEWLDW